MDEGRTEADLRYQRLLERYNSLDRNCQTLIAAASQVEGRVTELLQSNNALEERARKAERKLKLYEANALVAEFKTKLHSFDLVEYLELHQSWSLRTFGPRDRDLQASIIDHIKKEIVELEDPACNDRLMEWIDIVILALDGASRAGARFEEICYKLSAKMATNMVRKWPDWRTTDPTKAIEHVREY